MKKIFKIALIVAISIFVLVFTRDLIIKYVISTVASQITGTRVTIGGFSLSLSKQSARMNNFRMYNPKGFSKGVLVDLPKVYVDFDIPAFLKGKLHLRRLELELRELSLEKNREGKLNVDSLKVVEKNKEKARPGKERKALPMQIDLINLNIGIIVHKDLAVPKPPFVEAYDINLIKKYKHITSAEQLVVLILAEPMKEAGIKGAEIYGLALFTGVGVIPITIASKFAEKDSVEENFDLTFDSLYDKSLGLLGRIGKIKKESKSAGVIEADV